MLGTQLTEMIKGRLKDGASADMPIRFWREKFARFGQEAASAWSKGLDDFKTWSGTLGNFKTGDFVSMVDHHWARGTIVQISTDSCLVDFSKLQRRLARLQERESGVFEGFPDDFDPSKAWEEVFGNACPDPVVDVKRFDQKSVEEID